VIGRLFQRFQQCVKGGVGNLVRFIEDVNLEAVSRWTVACPFAEFTNFVDAAIGGCIDLDHIDRISGANLRAGFANTAGFGDWLVR
jgi:hypothetical protein